LRLFAAHGNLKPARGRVHHLQPFGEASEIIRSAEVRCVEVYTKMSYFNHKPTNSTFM